MKIRNADLDLSKTTYVMGILNVTPDSFSDGGLHNKPDEAVAHAQKMIKEGAAIIDIGGESTRPGFEGVSEEEELERVIPVIEALRKVSDIPISIDTTKPNVAKAALEAGADIINTVEGVDVSEEMLKVVKDSGAPFVMTYEKSYVNQFGEALISMAQKAVDFGIEPEKIIIDPGIGFGKTQDENLRILNELPIITQTGYPVLLGCSRKSVIKYVNERYGKTVENPDDKGYDIIKERLPGTVVTTVLAALAGVGMVRVHDVDENIKAIRMLTAICEV
ncbi:MAG: dihydropteroate synthase [Lachnospiraceae bacterium]|nr:dihydropteroate synthase [Lachnospiraceae bacterium]